MCGSTVFPHLTNRGIGGGGGGSYAAVSGGWVQGMARYIFQMKEFGSLTQKISVLFSQIKGNAINNNCYFCKDNNFS